MPEPDFDNLSAAASETAWRVGRWLEAGLTKTEIAVALGITRHELRRRLERLHRELYDAPVVCASCGAPLPPGGRSHRRYCSGRCRVAAHRRRVAQDS